jgi:hypothetical protein
VTITDEVPASIGQRLVWFLERYRSESSSVSCPALFRIRGEVDDGRLEAVAESLVARHEALRTTLVRNGRNLVQRLHDSVPAPVRTVDLPEGAQEELTRRIAEEVTAPIPVETSPVRFTSWRLGYDERIWCVNMHHLISDAWSCGIVVDDVVQLLRGSPADPSSLRPVSWQFRDFCRWEQEAARSGELQAHQDYWNAKLRDLQLPVLPDPGRRSPSRSCPPR